MIDLTRRSERWLAFVGPLVLLMALALLHVALVQGPLTPAGKAMLLVHLGLVLLWQPLVSGARKLSPLGLVLFVLVLGAAALWLSWGVLLLWGVLLAGIVGGKVFCYPAMRDRISYWLVLMYLVLVLVGIVLPGFLGGVVALPDSLPTFANWIAFPVLGAVLLIGLPEGAGEDSGALDLVGTLMIVLVLAGVLLGALAFMFVGGSDYGWALVQAFGVVAGALLLLGLVWSPRAGFSGLGLEISRKVLSGGQPFAQWLGEVADLSQREASADELVRAALERLLRWPGVNGVFWKVGERSAWQSVGQPGQHVTHFRHGSLELALNSQRPLAPTPAWHLDLMLRMLAEFHSAKQQAQRLQALSFLRAVHETGARTTHEIKNLLQSLDALCYAVLEDGGRNPEGLRALLQGQLPQIRTRLEQAMQRIRRPRDEDLRPVSVESWWQALQTRHTDARIRFEAEFRQESVPAALFDCVADNLLDNALLKAGAPGVVVRLVSAGDGCRLSVEDTGAEIGRERASALFLQPLASDTGLGIGLYQAGRLAESAAYRLWLDENRPGCVRFVLAPQQPA